MLLRVPGVVPANVHTWVNKVATTVCTLVKWVLVPAFWKLIQQVLPIVTGAESAGAVMDLVVAQFHLLNPPNKLMGF